MTDVTTTTPAVDEYAPPSPPSEEKTYFGEVVLVDAWDCILERGKGKVIFDPSIHEAYRRVKAIKISVECTSKDGGTYTIDLDVISDSKEWRLTYPTIGAIGRTVPTLKGSFVQVKRVPTGEHYTNKTTGEQKPKTTFKFIASYPDRDAMTAAADVFYTPRAERLGVELAIVADLAEQSKSYNAPAAPQPAQPTAASAPVATIDRATAATFLPMFWAQAAQDKGKFYEAVKTNPVTAPHFSDHTAPEMLAYLGDDFDPDLPF